MSKKVLVTGADGFIGSHLVEYLLSQGYEVRALTLYNSFGSYGWLDTLTNHQLSSVEIIPGDIRDAHQVSEVVKGIDTIFHLAALISIPYSYQAPNQFIQVNIGGTLNILQAARQHNSRRVLITSTSEVYGSARYIPIDENHPLQGQSPYSASKIGADKLAESFYRSFDLPVAVVRPFNTYGPRQSVRAIIPSVITRLLQNEREIKLGNLTPTRDLVYVKDTVEGFERLSQSESAIGREVNIATGKEISMGDLVSELIGMINPEAKIISDPDRTRPESSEVFRLLGDNNLLKNLTGWTPGTSLKDGLAETISWFADEQNLSAFPQGRYYP